MSLEYITPTFVFLFLGVFLLQSSVSLSQHWANLQKHSLVYLLVRLKHRNPMIQIQMNDLQLHFLKQTKIVLYPFFYFFVLCAFFFVRDLYPSGFFLNACLDFFLESCFETSTYSQILIFLSYFSFPYDALFLDLCFYCGPLLEMFVSKKV